jgi:hypothetical protein
MSCNRQSFRRLASGLLLVLSVAATGCDRPPPRFPEVPIEVRILWPVGDVDDRSSSPGELKLVKRVFVPGCEPSDKDLPKYTLFRYEGKSPVQNGDSATVTVVLKDAETGAPAGEMQWSLVRIKGVWRIKDAPLPPAKETRLPPEKEAPSAAKDSARPPAPKK